MVTDRVYNSPLFQNASWDPSMFPTSNTQFGDAFQRANFWSYVNKVSPDYHVLLNPITVAAPITINVPVMPGASFLQNPICLSQAFGAVPQAYMDAAVRSALPQLGVTPDTLVFFLTYDTVYPLQVGEYIGWHQHLGGQTYIVGSFLDSYFGGIFHLPGATDISLLSHEFGEWIDNPLGVNQAPQWAGTGVQTSCGTDLEVGDPLTGSVTSYIDETQFTFHPQELAYFSWFEHDVPSLAFGGRYSTNGTFGTFSQPCALP